MLFSQNSLRVLRILYKFIHNTKLEMICLKETGKGSGIEVKESRPDSEFTLPDGTKPPRCQYTHKVFHCDRFVSNFVRKLAYRFFGKNSLKFTEDAWNCYPFIYTISNNMEKPNKVEMNFESMHIDGDKLENDQPKYIIDSKLLKKKLSLKGVTIKHIDITEKNKKMRMVDPTKYRSEKAGIGPLPMSDKKKFWFDDFEGPVMCAYKLSRIRLVFSNYSQLFFKGALI